MDYVLKKPETSKQVWTHSNSLLKPVSSSKLVTSEDESLLHTAVSFFSFHANNPATHPVFPLRSSAESQKRVMNRDHRTAPGSDGATCWVLPLNWTGLSGVKISLSEWAAGAEALSVFIGSPSFLHLLLFSASFHSWDVEFWVRCHFHKTKKVSVTTTSSKYQSQTMIRIG